MRVFAFRLREGFAFRLREGLALRFREGLAFRLRAGGTLSPDSPLPAVVRCVRCPSPRVTQSARG